MTPLKQIEKNRAGNISIFLQHALTNFETPYRVIQSIFIYPTNPYRKLVNYSSSIDFISVSLIFINWIICEINSWRDNC
jgi:hypothetical protein